MKHKSKNGIIMKSNIKIGNYIPVYTTPYQQP